MKNQHLVIKNYLEQKESEKAEEYMERMYGINHGMELFVYTEIDSSDHDKTPNFDYSCL